MKVSDELREFADAEVLNAIQISDLKHIANRIDSEMVELPKDADGVTIHAGDTVWDVEDGMEFVVKSVTLYAVGVTKVDAVCDGCHAHVSPDSFSHTRPDSFERIADELDEQAGSLTKDGYTWQEDAIHDFADRIRKLAEKDGERS